MDRNELRVLLVDFLEKHNRGDEADLNPERLGMERLKEELPQISDPEKLISLWREVLPTLKALIKARLSEVLKEQLPQISDAEKLISLWREVPPALEALIEARLSEVLKEQLPQISDAEKLISLWRTVPSALKALIEARLSEVFERITVEDIPEWFGQMIKTKSTPEFLKGEFEVKARELLQVLSKE